MKASHTRTWPHRRVHCPSCPHDCAHRSCKLLYRNPDQVNGGVNDSTKELAIGDPHSAPSPSASPDRVCPSACWRPQWRVGVRLGRGGQMASSAPGVGCPLVVSPGQSRVCRCVRVCPAPAQSWVCKCVCVCALTSAVTGVQVCMCALHQAWRHLGSIPLLRAPSPPGPLFSLTQVTFQPFPSPLFLRPPPQLSQPDMGVGGQGGRERPTTFSGQPLTPNTLPPPVLGLLRIHPQCCSWD